MDVMGQIQKIDEKLRSLEQEQARLEERHAQITDQLAEVNDTLDKLGITNEDDVRALEEAAAEKLQEAEDIILEIEEATNEQA